MFPHPTTSTSQVCYFPLFLEPSLDDSFHSHSGEQAQTVPAGSHRRLLNHLDPLILLTLTPPTPLISWGLLELDKGSNGSCSPLLLHRSGLSGCVLNPHQHFSQKTQTSFSKSLHVSEFAA